MSVNATAAHGDVHRGLRAALEEIDFKSESMLRHGNIFDEAAHGRDYLVVIRVQAG